MIFNVITENVSLHRDEGGAKREKQGKEKRAGVSKGSRKREVKCHKLIEMLSFVILC